MAIPGLKPTFDVRAKVRIGEKRTSARGNEYPASVDHFLCDDPEFQNTVCSQANADTGGWPRELRIFFPYAKAEDNFSTGLEWWQGKLLACYSKGEEKDGVPVALRRATIKRGDRDVNLLEGARLLSEETVGQDRRLIECPVRDCPIFKDKKNGCKPMGRLLFWIDGFDQRGGVFQIDTKSWNTIEALEGVLGQYPDLRGIPFILRVRFEQRGTDRFPVLSLEEDVEINNEDDVALADALVQLRRAYDTDQQVNANASQGGTGVVIDVRTPLAAVLDLTNPGWRDGPEFVARIREVGVVAAARALLEKHGV